MELNRMIVSWPFSFFILLALTGLLLPSSLIPFWIMRIKRLENEMKVITNNSHHEIMSAIQNAAHSLSPMTSSATNLAKVLKSSLDKTELTFLDINMKVAPVLFQALSTIPRLSQISYIRKDGLIFAFYYKGNQEIFAIYSNTTFSTRAGNNYLWYTQPVDHNTGKPYGDAVLFAPRVLVNQSWFRQALSAKKGYAALGNSWNDVNDLLILNTAGIDKTGVISLGFELKSLIKVFSGINLSCGHLYLATKDGKVLISEGIPSACMVLKGNSSFSFHFPEPNADQLWNVGNVTSQLNDGSLQASILDHFSTKCMLYFSSINIIGLQLVYVLAVPYDGPQSQIHRNLLLVFVLLAVMFITVVIFMFNFVVLTVRAARKEMCLTAALIKQKEATQQAERKSKNRSLAFVTASHDIRASLAGITGLIEMSASEVHQESELAKNLRLMENCSKDLYGILNSVLDMSKIEAGKMQLEEKEFDMVKVLEGVVDLFYPVGLKKEVDVILDLHDGSLTRFSLVKGDERRLKQILSNLLNNAIKFTSDGYVSVRAWARKPSLENLTFVPKQNQSTSCLSGFFFRNDEVTSDLESIEEVHRDPNCMEFVFEVIDTGKGIPKEKQQSIFENYVQVKDTAPEFEGTGLGLGIVHSLVRLMGGEISIIDKEAGEKGTCFRFNAFFKVCQSHTSGIFEDHIESRGDSSPGPDNPFCNPKRKGYFSSLVVLFIRSNERRRATQKFIEAKGIEVSAVEDMEQFSETLKGLRQQQQHFGSSRSDLNLSFGYLSWPTSRNSSTRPKEVPLSALDGADDQSPTQRTNQVSITNFILLVMDTNGVDFRELCKAVAEFRKDSSNSSCSRVVWLGSKNIHLQGLDEKKLPPSDLILPMPLHGSRLYSLISLLPEFGGELPYMLSQTNQQEAGLKEQNSSTRKEGEIQEIGRPRTSSKSPLRGKKVLVAEDDSVQQTIAKSILLKLGITVQMCRNGKEALALVCQGLSDQRNLGASHIPPYDYILMDCQMPVMDGCEATRRIRLEEKEYGVHIPIIGLTAHAEGGELNMLLVSGIDIHLPKPLNRQKLLKVIEDLHSRK